MHITSNSQDFLVSKITKGESLVIIPSILSNAAILLEIALVMIVGVIFALHTSPTEAALGFLQGVFDEHAPYLASLGAGKLVNTVMMLYVLFLCGRIFVNIHSFEYVITRETITSSTGFFAKDTMQAPITQGVLPTTSQSVLGKLCGYGDISLTLNTNNAATDTVISMFNVDNPVKTSEVITAVAEAMDNTQKLHSAFDPRQQE